MRKITLLLSLCAALFAGTTQASAQITTVGVSVSSVDDIRDGYKYAIKNVGTSNKDRNGYIYENEDGALKVNTTAGANADLTTVENSGQYIFTAHKTDAGFTLETPLGKYVGTAGSGSLPTAETGATITFTAKPNSAAYVWNIQSDGNYWNVEPGQLVVWNPNGLNDANGKFEIVPVNADDFESYTSIVYTFDNGTTVTVNENGNLLPNQKVDILCPTYVDMTSASFSNSVLSIQANITTPFAYSSSYETATWNYLTLSSSRYFLRDTNGAASMSISGNTTTDPGISDADLWAFVGDPINGFKIYNKQAGSGKILSSSTTMSSSDNGGSTFPVLTDETSLPEGNNTTWDATPSSYATDGFFLAQHGIAANRMNNRNGNLAYWSTGADDGSTFVADNPVVYLLSGVVGEAPDGAVGTWTKGTANKEEAQTVYASKSIDDYRTLYPKLGNLITLETGKYYRLLNAYKSQYLANVENKQNCPLTANEIEAEARLDASTIVTFDGDAGNGYRIKSEGLCVSKAGKVQATQNKGIGLTATDADIDRFKFVSQGHTTTLLAIKSTTTSNANSYLHSSGVKGNLDSGQGGGIVLWSATAEASRWYIVPATDIDVTLNAVESEGKSYATVHLPFATTTGDVKAYYATANDGTNVTMTETTDGIAANQGALLVSESGATTATLTIADDVTAPTSNLLKGTNVATTITDANDYYIFGNGDAGVGFYHPSATTLKANRAYIEAGTAAAASLKLSFGQTTGIGSIVNPAADAAAAPLYDLQGRRVNSATKGIYIQGGKKVYVK